METTFGFWAWRQFGWGATQVAWVMTYVGVLGAIVQGGLIRHLVRRFGEERVLAVGTTTLRALESAAAGGALAAGYGDTSLFILPDYRFRVVERLLTNFHLPRSTLIMLVSAFAGADNIRDAYRHAIEKRYRFYSYGDAMLIERSDR